MVGALDIVLGGADGEDEADSKIEMTTTPMSRVGAMG